MSNFISILADTTVAGTDSTTAAGSGTAALLANLATFIPIVLVFVVMYFLMIRPQKKKQKEEQKMRSSMRVGDEITTIGGITGRVLNVKEDSLVIETGADRSKLTIKKWAVQSVDTIHDANDVADDDDDDDI